MEKSLDNFDLEYDEDGKKPVVTITLATDRHDATVSHENPEVAEPLETKLENTKGHYGIFTMILISCRNKLRCRISDQRGEVIAQLGCGLATGTESEGSRRIDLAMCNTPRIPISWLLPSNVMTVKLNQSICLHRSYRSTIIQ